MYRLAFSNGNGIDDVIGRLSSRMIGMISLFVVSMFFMATFTATSHAAQVTLAWEATGGSNAGYRLFARAEGQNYDYSQPKWQGTATSSTIHQLEDSKTHYFVMRTFDSQGNESANSNEVVFTPAASATPPKDETPRPPVKPGAQFPPDNAQEVQLEPELRTGEFNSSFSGDYHTHTRWRVHRESDNWVVFDLYTNKFLTRLEVPPLVLNGRSAYFWTAQHFNQGGSPSPKSNMRFTTAEWPGDDNGNGIPDSLELSGPTDLDRNGQPDDQQPDMKRFISAIGDQKIGIQVKASTGSAQLGPVQSIDFSSVSNPSSVQPDFPAGLYNFRVDVDTPGATVVTRVHFSSPVQSSYHFYMFDPAVGYVDFGTSRMIAPNGTTATFEIQDGGEGDMDGIENGIIVAIGGYASPPNSANLSGSGSGGGGGGCFIMISRR
jgi:hypothetical protein